MSTITVNGHKVSAYDEGEVKVEVTREAVQRFTELNESNENPFPVYLRERDLVAMLRVCRGEVPNTSDTYKG